jgi:hypothetical protein
VGELVVNAATRRGRGSACATRRQHCPHRSSSPSVARESNFRGEGALVGR